MKQIYIVIQYLYIANNWNISKIWHFHQSFGLQYLSNTNLNIPCFSNFIISIVVDIVNIIDTA